MLRLCQKYVFIMTIIHSFFYPSGGYAQILESSITASETMLLGQFLVTWDGTQLAVTKKDGAIIWASQGGKAWLFAEAGRVNVKGARGSFKIQDLVDIQTKKQTVEDVSFHQDQNAAEVRGKLISEHGVVAYVFRISLQSDKEVLIHASLEPSSRFNRINLVYASKPDEKIFGFGANFSYFDVKGRSFPIWAQEQGHGRGVFPLTMILNSLGAHCGGNWATTYTAVPLYMTNYKRAAYSLDRTYMIFNMEEASSITLKNFASSLSLVVLGGESPLDLIETYTRYTGRMLPLPDWAHDGAIIGTGGGALKVREVASLLETYHVKVSAYFLQDWVGQRKTPFGPRLWWNWEADTSLYGDWPAFVKELKMRGYRVLSYVNPFLTDASHKKDVTRDLYTEAKKLGFLVKNSSSDPYEIGSGGFSAAMIDFSNPKAAQWFKEMVHRQIVSTGVDGWMADFGEALPHDAKLEHAEAFSYHNQYVEDFARVQDSVMSQSILRDDGLFFMRTGNLTSPRYVKLFWLGDQLTTWDEFDGIKSTVTALLSSGISGYSLNHSDIGGYLSIKVLGQPLFYRRPKELLLRWMELNAFTPVFRTHEGNSAGHQFYSDDETLRHFAKFSRLFHLLKPYRDDLMREAGAKGYPLVRHLYLHYPNDPEVFNVPYQFLLGKDLLVAPVLDPGLTSKKVYLPHGDWRHVWTGRIFASPSEGQYVEVSSPLGRPPVFSRVGTRAEYLLQGAGGW